jgi:hypothetical protein
MILGVVTLLAFGSLINGFRAGKQFDGLNEYKRKGTIKGIKAWRILDDPQHEQRY